jgi:hypothetical protein
MTWFRQIEANRRNALRSTGPNTEEGKHRSRQNGARHGLCAESVIEIVEDIDDYRGFEAAVIADYDARTAVERELVLRLASLLWRLRRASAIETDLIRIQAEILRDRRQRRSPDWSDNRASPIVDVAPISDAHDNENDNAPWPDGRCAASPPAPKPINSSTKSLFPATRQSRQARIRAARTLRVGDREANSENASFAKINTCPVS